MYKNILKIIIFYYLLYDLMSIYNNTYIKKAVSPIKLCRHMYATRSWFRSFQLYKVQTEKSQTPLFKNRKPSAAPQTSLSLSSPSTGILLSLSKIGMPDQSITLSR